MIAWMAMGFSEGHAGPGWYKEDNTVKFFTHSGNDAEATAEHAKQVISERCAEFAADPGEALRFFSTKLRTQWNEPTYESVWINQVQQSYSEKGGLYELFCGRGEQFFGGVMNQFQQLIFFGVLLSLFELWRRRVMESSLLPLIILGAVRGEEPICPALLCADDTDGRFRLRLVLLSDRKPLRGRRYFYGRQQDRTDRPALARHRQGVQK